MCRMPSRVGDRAGRRGGFAVVVAVAVVVVVVAWSFPIALI